METASNNAVSITPSAYVCADGSQMFDVFYQPSQVLNPEQRLARALILDGINRCDMEWVQTPGYEWPLSFDNCCEWLKIDPSWLRSRLSPLLADQEARKVRRARRGGRPSPININDDEIGHKFGGQKHCVKCSRVYHRAYMARKKAGI